MKRTFITIASLIVFVLVSFTSLGYGDDSFQYPLDGPWTVIQDFGVWNSAWGGYHLAEDASAPIGTPVYASANGTVKFASTGVSGYGGLVIIGHSEVCTLYGHLSQSLGIQVSSGQDVSKGQLIGYIADPNEYGYSGSSHIHFGIRLGQYTIQQFCGHWAYVGYSQSCSGITHSQYLAMWTDPSDFITGSVTNVAEVIRDEAVGNPVLVTVDGQPYMIVTLGRYIDPETLEPSEVSYTPIVYVDAQWNPVSNESIAQKIHLIRLAQSMQEKHMAAGFKKDVVMNMESILKSPSYRIGRYSELFLDLPSRFFARTIHEFLSTGKEILEGDIRSAIQSATSKNLLEEVFNDPSVAVEFSLYFDLDDAKKEIEQSLNIEQGREITDFNTAFEYLRHLHTAQAYSGIHWWNALFKMSKLDQSTWSRVWDLAKRMVEDVLDAITLGIYSKVKTFLEGALGEVKNIPWVDEYYAARDMALSSVSGKLSSSKSQSVEYTLSLAEGTSKELSIPDLTVSSVYIDPTSVETGGRVFVTFTIRNSGDMPSGMFTTRISISFKKWGTDVLLGNIDIDSLEGKSSRQSTTEAYIPRNISLGDYYVTVYADVFREIDESEEGNNIGSTEPQMLSVSEPPRIDLAVTQVDAPFSATPGDSISVSFTVANQGTSPSGSFTNRVFVANTPQSIGISLGNFDMASLEGRNPREETAEVTIPSTISPGDYYITVLTDAFRAIAETNENNNIGSTPRKISIFFDNIVDNMPPQVSIGAPNGGENWVVGTQQTIRWNATDNIGVDHIDIQFSSDGGTIWSDIATGISNSGQHDWTPTSDTVSNTCRIKVIAYDVAGNSGFDISDGTFVISPQPPTLSAPILYDPGLLSESGNYTIDWSDVSEATSYTLQEDVNTLFSNPVEHTVASSSKYITGKNNGLYYYRVKANNNSGSSDWSKEVVDIEVKINSPPNVPSNPSPANGATDVSRTLTLSWTGGDPDGTADYAVLLGTNPSDLTAYRGFGSGQTGESFKLEFTLNPATIYYWQVKAKDDKGLLTIGPTWHFTTEYSYADIVPTSLTVTGTIAPDAQITLNLTVANQGTFTAPGCQAFFYYSATSTGKDEKFVGLGVVVPELAPSGQATITKEVTLEHLRAGLSYIVAEVDTQTYFIEKNLDNNLISYAIDYQDTEAPVISYLELRGGIGNRFKTGYKYSITFEVTDDIEIDSLDFFYSIDNGATWNTIITEFVIGSNGISNAYEWTIPADAPLIETGKIKMIARDTSGNDTVGYTQIFSIIDGSAPYIRVISPNGGEVWDLGSQHEITWEASSSSGIEEVGIYLYWADKADVITYPAADATSYMWTLPTGSNFVTNTARIKIRVVDANWNETEDWSDDYFIIHDPSAPPPPPWNMPEVVTSVPPENIPYTTKDNMMPAIAADHNGDVHLVYKYIQDGHGEPRVILQQILHKKCVGSNWSTEDIVFSLTQNSDANLTNYHSIKRIRMAIDSNNHPHLVWCDYCNRGEIYYCYNNGSAWSTPLKISDGGIDSERPKIAIDSQDNVHIVWMGNRNTYYKKRNANGGWSAISQLSPGYGTWPDIAVDSSDNLHVVFTSGNLYYLKWNGVKWSNPVPIIEPLVSNYLPDISCEANGSGLHLVWYNVSIGQRILYSHYDGNSWSSPEEINDSDLTYYANYPSIAVDSSNNPHVIWEEGSHGGVVYRQKQPSGWSRKIQVNLASQGTGHQDSTAVAMSLNDIFHVVWVSYYNGHMEVFHNYADISLDLDTEAPTVTLTSPVSDEQLSIDETYEIKWSASDNVGVSSISLKYTTDGETFTEIASGEDNDGTHQWVVPNIVSDTVQIWLIASDAASNQGATVSGYFSISDRTAPSVSLTSPNGGETWMAESQHDITWSATDNVEVVSIDLFYSTDAGNNWLNITKDEPNDGTYLWTIPYNLSSKCKVKVIAYDSSNQMSFAVSDGTFSIATTNNPPYTPHSPVPAHNSENVSLNIELIWIGGDPDSGDTVTYDVYFGTSTEPSLVFDDQSDTSYTPNTLKPNTPYYWQIIAFDGKESSPDPIPIWTFTTGTENINAPSNLSAVTISNNQIDLSWEDNSNNEEGFKIERKKEADETYSEIKVVGADVSTYSDVGLNGGTTYIYRVRAYYGSVYSVYSNETKATTLNSLPNTPSNPTPADNAADQLINIQLSWQGGDPDAGDTVTYDVYFGTTSEPPLVSDDQSETTYNPGALEHHKFYYWKIVATDSHGDSVSGPIWSFVTETEPAPVAPTYLSASPISYDQVKLTWTDNSDNELGFKIERKMGPDGIHVQISEVGADIISYTDTNLSPNTTYFYRVRAYNSSSHSTYSNEAYASTSLLYGDVDSDGRVTAYDATLILRYGAGITELIKTQKDAADVSGDDTISAYDAALILRHVVGLIAKFPVEESPPAAPQLSIVKVADYGVRFDEGLCKPGMTFTVSVKVEDASSIFASEIELSYDPSLLMPLEVKAASGYFLKYRADSGQLRIWLARAEAFEGSGSLVEVTFKVGENVATPIKGYLSLSKFKLNETTLDKKALTEFTIQPYQFKLLPNYPNPFNPDTWIPYELAEEAEVAIEIYNLAGQLIRSLNLGLRPRGTYYSKSKAAHWDGRNDAGEHVASGVYFYHLQAGSFQATKKMVIAK